MQRSVSPVRVGLLFAVVASSVCIACTSSETAITTAPTSNVRCQIAANSSTGSFTANGGAATINVSTDRDCTWTVTTDANWVSISGERNGQGDASVPYTVAPNPVPVARSGAILVGSTRVQLSQAAAPCAYSLSRTGDAIDAGGGTLAFDVGTLTGCPWSASSDAGWLVIAAGRSGNASGTVTLAVAANTGEARVGHVAVAGRTYTVSQAAAGGSIPVPTPSPDPLPPPASGEQVHLEGTASLVGGSCPDITFVVGGRQVVTDRNTEYDKKNDCTDLKTGSNVTVDGTDAGAFVTAAKISIDNHH